MSLTVVWQVENTLFKIPRNGFEQESEVFRDMFSLPSGEDESLEGASDGNPIILEDVQAAAFRLLLQMMYPRCANSQPM